MESFEPKKLALIRIWQILKEYSDYDHPLTQDDIAKHLENEYGIVIERKAISRNISLLKEAGIEIESRRAGTYLEVRDFEDSELKLLIDGVLCSKYITAKHSSDLIDRLCGLSNKCFRSHVKNIYSVNDWSKTENQALFYNIELIDAAIEQKLRIGYDYNKFGIDKKLHKSSHQVVTPYQLILHNQRYRLLCHLKALEFWDGFEDMRNLHYVRKPFIVKDYGEHLEDQNTLFDRAKDTGRQVIVLLPVNKEREKTGRLIL